MFPFQAGQFVMLHLFNDDGGFWAKSAYSIASAPGESKESFELGIKLKGDFTRRLSGLKLGDEVGVQGPYGAFTLKRKNIRMTFLGGGIGITPLRSMIREALLTKDSAEIFLFYAEKNRKQMSYEKEFRDLAARHKNFHVIFVLTREYPAGWDGEKERISGKMLKKYLSNLNQGEFLLCGPRSFMDSMQEALVSAGVDPKTQIRKELFG